MQRLATIAVAVLLAVGCGSGDDDSPSQRSSSERPTTSTTTTPPPTPESQVEAAYLAYWEMADRLLEAPDPDDPQIAERTIDPARGQLTDSLTTLQSQGQAVRSGPSYGHGVLSVAVSGQSAVVRDCVIDDNAVVEVSTGSTVESRVTTVMLAVTLRHSGLGWRVSAIDQEGSWDGATTCDR